jgi:hypothetical protein
MAVSLRIGIDAGAKYVSAKDVSAKHVGASRA